MIFVYLIDGERLEIPDAVSVVHHDQIVFLDKDDQIVRQVEPEGVLAYSHVLYEGDRVTQMPEVAFRSVIIELLDKPETAITPRARHGRRRTDAPEPLRPRRRKKGPAK